MLIIEFIVLSGVIQVLLLKFVPPRIHVVAVVLGGALASVLAWQVLAYVESGFLDPFFLIAAVVELAIALSIGAVVAFVMHRKAKTST